MSSGWSPSGKLSPVRIAVNVALGVWVVLEWSIRLRSRLNRQGARLDRNSMLVVVASAVAGVGGGIALARALHQAAMPDARWLLVTGLVLMGAGIAFRQWAVAVLGRFFTVDVRVHPGQTVVERGPYRWLRHPSYTGLIATFLGLGLALDNWAALAVLAVLPTAGLVYRIHFEERALLDGLGEPYRRFAASRPRLFPGVW
jgi:protein-S-isoprenylcysteine O-methyltransferase Ste14